MAPSLHAGLVQGTDGNLYGTTYLGGASGCNGASCGTVFKITQSGALTTLAQLLRATNCLTARTLTPRWCKRPTGTFTGQPARRELTADGTVFKITPSGTLTSALQLLFSTELRRWYLLSSRAGARHRREPLRDYLLRRGKQQLLVATIFKITTARHTDHTAQLPALH